MNREEIHTMEEAIQICQEHQLTVHFEGVVRVSSQSLGSHQGKDLLEAINGYVAMVIQQNKKEDKRVMTKEDQYDKDLYCETCGEDDKSKLAYEANYGGWERWICLCGHAFQIKALVSE